MAANDRLSPGTSGPTMQSSLVNASHLMRGRSGRAARREALTVSQGGGSGGDSFFDTCPTCKPRPRIIWVNHTARELLPIKCNRGNALMNSWGKKNFIFLFLFALLSANSVWGVSEKLINQRKFNRLHHARELLGKHYMKSVVRAGEKTVEVPAFVFDEVKEHLKPKYKNQARGIAKAIVHESQKYGFDPIFVMALIEHESRFEPDQLGSFGEIGLMQIKPSTAKWIADKYKIEWKGDRSLRDGAQNIVYGTAYIDYLREEFESHSRLYLAAYNMGATNVHRNLERQIWPKQYASKVMQNYVKFYAELRKGINNSSVETEQTHALQQIGGVCMPPPLPEKTVAKDEKNADVINQIEIATATEQFKKGGL